MGIFDKLANRDEQIDGAVAKAEGAPASHRDEGGEIKAPSKPKEQFEAINPTARGYADVKAEFAKGVEAWDVSPRSYAEMAAFTQKLAADDPALSEKFQKITSQLQNEGLDRSASSYGLKANSDGTIVRDVGGETNGSVKFNVNQVGMN